MVFTKKNKEIMLRMNLKNDENIKFHYGKDKDEEILDSNYGEIYIDVHTNKNCEYIAVAYDRTVDTYFNNTIIEKSINDEEIEKIVSLKVRKNKEKEDYIELEYIFS
ncbi:hypothetical protein JCM1393_23720 [Clostridium carnis]